MIQCTCAPDKIFSKRMFVRQLQRRWWRTAPLAATDSEAKSANDPASQGIHWRLSDLRIGTKMSHCTCAPDKFFSKRTFVWRLRRRRWRTAAAATATDSQAKSAVSAFADRAPLLLSSSQFHIKVCSICRMDNFHVPLGNRWRSLSVWYESYRQGLC